MKNLLLVFGIAMLVFTSCSKDEECPCVPMPDESLAIVRLTGKGAYVEECIPDYETSTEEQWDIALREIYASLRLCNNADKLREIGL